MSCHTRPTDRQAALLCTCQAAVLCNYPLCTTCFNGMLVAGRHAIAFGIATPAIRCCSPPDLNAPLCAPGADYEPLSRAEEGHQP
jgi:hypothetical protein